MENSLKELEKSLTDKVNLLNEIDEYNEKQNKLFSSENFDFDSIDKYLEEKGELIERLEKLDDGFEELYERVGALLADNKDKYASEIRKLQELIAQITEKGEKIQAQENASKALMQECFSKKKHEIGESRKSADAALNYHKAQYSGNYIDMAPQIMDSKQ